MKISPGGVLAGDPADQPAAATRFVVLDPFAAISLD